MNSRAQTKRNEMLINFQDYAERQRILKTEKLNIKAKAHVTSMTTSDICKALEQLEGNYADYAPTVRGWLMDELEERHPEQFEAWLDCDDSELMGKVSQFFV